MTEVDGLELVHPQRYAEKGYPHELWTRLRRDSPVAWFDPPGYRGFWALTKHADIAQVSKQPEKFLNAPRLTVARKELDEMRARRGGIARMRTLVNMDPPEHRRYRKLASPWFTPRNLRILEERMRASARELVDRMMETGRCDFVFDVAARRIAVDAKAVAAAVGRMTGRRADVGTETLAAWKRVAQRGYRRESQRPSGRVRHP